MFQRSPQHPETATGTNDPRAYPVAYHYMDEHGGYDGWGEYKVVLSPSFDTIFNVKVTGGKRKYSDIKNYIVDVLDVALNREVLQTIPLDIAAPM